MARKAPLIMLTDFEVKVLQSVKLHCPDQQLAKRCAAILECAAGRSSNAVAADTGLAENTVGFLRRTVAAGGIESLITSTYSGTLTDADIASRIIGLITDSSKDWTSQRIAEEINAPVKRVRSVLRDMDIPLQRQRIWTIQSSEAVLSDHIDLIGLYLTRTSQGMLLCHSEQVQVPSRGELITRNSSLVNDFKQAPFPLPKMLHTAMWREVDRIKSGPETMLSFFSEQINNLQPVPGIWYQIITFGAEPQPYRGRLSDVCFLSFETFPEWLHQISPEVLDITTPDSITYSRDLTFSIFEYLAKSTDTSEPLRWQKPDILVYPADNESDDSLDNDVIEGEIVKDDNEKPEISQFRKDLKSFLKEKLPGNNSPDDVQTMFISVVYDATNVEISVAESDALPQPAEFDFQTIDGFLQPFSKAEQILFNTRNKAGVGAGENYLDLIKLKSGIHGIQTPVEIEGELGRMRTSLPIHQTSTLKGKERLKTSGFREQLSMLGIRTSFRVSADFFNRHYHRDAAGSSISNNTFRRYFMAEGRRIIATRQLVIHRTLLQYGFNLDATWPKEKDFPEEYINLTIDEACYLIDPAEVMRTMHPEVVWPPEGLLVDYDYSEHSLILEGGVRFKLDLTPRPVKPSRKKRPKRDVIDDENRLMKARQYVAFINTLEGRDPGRMIVQPFYIERSLALILYIFLDIVYVKKRKASIDTDDDENKRVSHVNIHIETLENGRYFNICQKTLEGAYAELIACIFYNHLENRFMLILIDGERRLETQASRYFEHRNFGTILDFKHFSDKSKQTMSYALSSNRVDSPFAVRKTLKSGPNKGEVRVKQISTSVLYGMELNARAWPGNIGNVRYLIRHLNPDEVKSVKRISDFLEYIEYKQTWFTCYAARRYLGLPNSSSKSEMLNEINVSPRQKFDKRASWADECSEASSVQTNVVSNQMTHDWYWEGDYPLKMHEMPDRKPKEVIAENADDPEKLISDAEEILETVVENTIESVFGDEYSSTVVDALEALFEDAMEERFFDVMEEMLDEELEEEFVEEEFMEEDESQSIPDL